MTQASDRIEKAVEAVLGEGRVIPADLGGSATCTAVTDAICAKL